MRGIGLSGEVKVRFDVVETVFMVAELGLLDFVFFAF